MHEFTTLLAKHADAVKQRLNMLLNNHVQEGEIARPELLLQAMRYGVLNGGKCLRPFFVIQSAALFDVPPEHALDVGVALECIHCYSLIHDDLPAMDNDILRRGKPTVHKAFDEATAILAGNALLTFAFEIIAHKACALLPQTRLNLITALAQAAGLGGMIGGQILDLEAEKKTARPHKNPHFATYENSRVDKFFLPSRCHNGQCFRIHNPAIRRFWYTNWPRISING